MSIGVWGGGGRGGSCPPNSGKQWVKFGQTVGEIRAKQEEKIGQRKLQINPFGMWMMTSHRQCPRGGGCLWMSKSRGVFQILGGWMTSRGQCPRGGACGYLCKISGKWIPLPPLTKAFPYAYAHESTLILAGMPRHFPVDKEECLLAQPYHNLKFMKD